MLPLYAKLTLYNSLILPHINFNLLIWGHQSNKIFKLQKRAIRSITNSPYNAHTDPLFKILKTLKIEDIYLTSKVKFYYKHVNEKLPSSFSELTFDTGTDRHDHRTRKRDKLVLSNPRHKFARASIHYSIPETINNLSSDITSKITTHSIKGLCLYIKNKRINEYPTICTTVNCYTCSRKDN